MLTIKDFENRTEQTLALLEDLVRLESPTTDKLAVDRLGNRIRQEFLDLGADVTLLPQAAVGDHVLAHFSSSSKRDGILCLCHMDTVHPLSSLERIPCQRVGEKLHGPGVQDMKAGIAMLITAIRALKEAGQAPDRPIAILITSDEEEGSLTSRAAIERLASQAGLVLCLEPSLPDGAIKTWRKGVGSLEVIAYGRAAHAGGHHAEGRNAIEEMAHQILAIQRMTDYNRGTTVNVGLIQGGTASNVVPDQVGIEVDLRVLSLAEAERVEQALHDLQPALEGTRLEVRGGLNRPPMPRDERMAQTVKRAAVIAARLGLELREGGTGGGSDANFVAALGIPVLDGLGAQGDGLHSEREHIVISSLPEKTALLASLLAEW